MEIYCNQPGQAKDSIIRKAGFYENDKEDDIIILWGVGNHGGINSAKDLDDIITLTDEKKGTWEIVHSTPDDYFNAITPTQDFSDEIIAFIKSYSSANAIKLAHDRLENAIYRAERFLSMLGIAGIYEYNKEAFKKAERILCQIEFHDVLSGTSIKTSTDSSIEKAMSAIQQVNAEFYNGYFRFSGMLPKAKDGDDCFVVLNPHPYEVTTVVETELFEPSPNNFEFNMYDSNNNPVDCQVILEESIINMTRRVRLIYKYTYPAMSVTQFGIHSKIVDYKTERFTGDNSDEDIILKDKYKQIKISRETGLIETHVVVNYKFYHDLPYIDVNIHVIWNSKCKGLKIQLPLNGKRGFFTQAAFGTQYNKNDGDEKPGNRFVGVENGEKAFVVYNRSGIHSYSMQGRDLYLTLLNGSAYCAHPTDPGTPIIKDNTRYTGFIEIGTHDFQLRIGTNDVCECEKTAQQFNQPLYSVLTFPHGNSTPPEKIITLSNENVVISAFKRRNNGTYVIRLHNNYKASTSTTININGISKVIKFKKYEFRTFIYNGKTIRESKDAALY